MIAARRDGGGLPEHDRRQLSADHAEAMSSPFSVRRRATLTVSRCASVARPHRAMTPPSSSGKWADPPKFTSAAGTVGREALSWCRRMWPASAVLPTGPGSGAHEDQVGRAGLGGAAASCLTG